MPDTMHGERRLQVSLEKAMDDHSTGITVVVCEQSINDKLSFVGKNLPVGC